MQSQHNKDLALPIQLPSNKAFLIPSKLLGVLGNKDRLSKLCFSLSGFHYQTSSARSWG